MTHPPLPHLPSLAASVSSCRARRAHSLLCTTSLTVLPTAHPRARSPGDSLFGLERAARAAGPGVPQVLVGLPAAGKSTVIESRYGRLRGAHTALASCRCTACTLLALCVSCALCLTCVPVTLFPRLLPCSTSSRCGADRALDHVPLQAELVMNKLSE
jgi:hypothetical protein